MVRRRMLVFAGLAALGAGIAAAVVVATSPSARHVQPPATTRPHAAHHAKPKPRLVSGPHDSPVPILMYHVLAAPPAGTPYPQLWVRPSDFAAQMDWMAVHGYHAVTLGQVFRYWHNGVALPARPFVASFDDGYLSDFTVAMPTLRKHGWAGVLNLIVNSVKPGDIAAGQVRALIKAGWEIDAHTIHHVDLTGVGSTQLQQEVAGSRADLRRMFGQPVDFFCYPAGRYNASVVAAVRAAGYLGATTVNPGLATPADPFTLNRIRIDYSDGLSGFATKLQRYAS
jgi:peptidoglycan/xylan/chitin deacetylase (PgdA/CDA1 family)